MFLQMWIGKPLQNENKKKHNNYFVGFVQLVLSPPSDSPHSCADTCAGAGRERSWRSCWWEGRRGAGTRTRYLGTAAGELCHLYSLLRAGKICCEVSCFSRLLFLVCLRWVVLEKERHVMFILILLPFNL